MKNSISDSAGPLSKAYPDIVKDYEAAMPGYSLQVTCVHRTPAEQYELYCQGRTKPGDVVTQIDGTTKLGAHNYYPARAIDVAVVSKATGRITWDEKLYAPLVAIATKYGLESGGGWTSFKDWPHIQIPHFRDWKGV
jgi:peptidoglycan L-alanyl-D-glutamate endopeptidase CwlK